MMQQKVTIFTDGSCLQPTPQAGDGPGGYGAIVRIGSSQSEYSAGYTLTTNNRMELMAVIRALAELREPSDVEINTDSQYVKRGISEWVGKWQENNWHTSARKPVKNQDLWKRLMDLCSGHQITWHWIKGHDGHPENERCDQLAREAAGGSELLSDEGYHPHGG